MRVAVSAEEVWPGGAQGDAPRAAPRFFFHSGFARLSPFVAATVFLLAPLAFAARVSTAPGPTAAVKRQAASSQYARAEEQRASLNAKAPDRRTLADYKQVVNAYRRVFLIAPRAG